MPEIKVDVTGNVAGGVAGLKTVQAELGKTVVSAQNTDSSVKVLGDNLEKSFTKPIPSLSIFSDKLTDLQAKLNANIDASGFDAVSISAKKVSGSLEILGRDVLAAQGYFVRLPGTLQTTSQALAKTAIEAIKLDSTLARGKVGVNQAAFAMQNLGRVAQDLPYGFIGIQNNLNPLLESFQRLKAETGSSKLALKALGSSLLGAGGLGFALSIASAAFLIFQNGFMSFGRSTKEATDENKKNKESIELSKSAYQSFLEVVDKVSETLANEASKVNLLFSALSDSNIGLKDRKEIIDQLIKISPAYFDGLSAEKSSYDQISAALLDYNDNLAKNAEIKALLPNFDKQFQNLIKLKVELNQFKRFQGPGGAFELPKDQFEQDSKVMTDKIRGLTNEIKRSKEALTLVAGGSLNLQEILYGKQDKKDAKVKTKKDIETISDVLAELNRELDFLSTKELIFRTNEAKEKISAIDSTIQTLIKKFKLTNENAIVLNLLFEADDIKTREELRKEIFSIKNLPTVTVPVALSLPQSGNNPTINPYQQWLDSIVLSNQKLEEQAAFVQGTLMPIFNSVVDSMISGSENIGDVFAEALKSIVAQLIKAAALAAILSLISGGAANGGFSFMHFFKGGLPGFATGVRDFGGGVAMVGERGPELVSLPRHSSVVPNGQLNAMGGGSNTFIPNVTIKGSDLVLVFNRQQQVNSRNG